MNKVVQLSKEAKVYENKVVKIIRKKKYNKVVQCEKKSTKTEESPNFTKLK